MEKEKNENIDVHDIYDTLWRCRDFEINHLWQRSVFLTAFLVLCFTGYGSALSKLADCLKDDTIFISVNIVCFALSLLGITFSIMWIKMGKGSKAWYEAYEHAIMAIEKNRDYATGKASEIGGFRFNRLPSYKNIEISNNIFSGRAGQFSPSRINTAIGQVFLITWLVIGVSHAVITGFRIRGLYPNSFYDILCWILGPILVLVITYFIGRPKLFASRKSDVFRTDLQSSEA
ncbi:RipA family octameric membrane protein [Cyclobacterium plantarum]|uniref:RipA family octameric membrane protein n=1 Tax=Cyclobacterium plantarum TaxID=2716263 RepID=UPI003F6FF31C